MIYFRDSDPVTFYPADMDHLECHKNLKISINNASDHKISELIKLISKTVKQGRNTFL